MPCLYPANLLAVCTKIKDQRPGPDHAHQLPGRVLASINQDVERVLHRPTLFDPHPPARPLRRQFQRRLDGRVIFPARLVLAVGVFPVPHRPATGAGLRKDAGVSDSDSVLNGIAWDAKGKRLFVTGKYWPKLYEIALANCA